MLYVHRTQGSKNHTGPSSKIGRQTSRRWRSGSKAVPGCWSARGRSPRHTCACLLGQRRGHSPLHSLLPGRSVRWPVSSRLAVRGTGATVPSSHTGWGWVIHAGEMRASPIFRASSSVPPPPTFSPSLWIQTRVKTSVCTDPLNHQLWV